MKTTMDYQAKQQMLDTAAVAAGHVRTVEYLVL